MYFPGTTQLYNTSFHSGFLIKNAFARNLRVAIRVGPPPISMISFLLTAHARNTTPAILEGEAGQVRAVWAVRSGQGGQDLHLDLDLDLSLESGIWSLESGVWSPGV